MLKRCFFVQYFNAGVYVGVNVGVKSELSTDKASSNSIEYK